MNNANVGRLEKLHHKFDLVELRLLAAQSYRRNKAALKDFTQHGRISPIPKMKEGFAPTTPIASHEGHAIPSEVAAVLAGDPFPLGSTPPRSLPFKDQSHTLLSQDEIGFLAQWCNGNNPETEKNKLSSGADKGLIKLRLSCGLVVRRIPQLPTALAESTKDMALTILCFRYGELRETWCHRNL
ncbi:hypothetical protein AC1031_010686 [Aphanomyces cochlioides]|nr:hypothetical protein AC1031_010686 [Aphanomyces cochlioides]